MRKRRYESLISSLDPHHRHCMYKRHAHSITILLHTCVAQYTSHLPPPTNSFIPVSPQQRRPTFASTTITFTSTTTMFTQSLSQKSLPPPYPKITLLPCQEITSSPSQKSPRHSFQEISSPFACQHANQSAFAHHVGMIQA